MKIHLLGPSGSGTSTLGKALGDRLGRPWFDSDDFFWIPTDPPFTTKRPADERGRLLAATLAENAWMSDLGCPVLRLERAMTTEEGVAAVLKTIDGAPMFAREPRK